MSDISTTVDLVYPTYSGVSIPTGSTIWVLFDREIDETSLDSSFFVTGPDHDEWSGPDMASLDDPLGAEDDADLLSSPDFHGMVLGTITTERILLASTGEYTGVDDVGNGALYRTKAIFTPTTRMTATTPYTVYVCGDDDTTDDVHTGICTRTVFDTVVGGSNTGTGVVTFKGGYTGTATNAFHVIITVAGVVGTSQFEWYLDSDPATIYGPLHTKLGGVELDDGVSVLFSDASYEVDDTFYAVVKAPTYFDGNLLWPFETGSGSIQVIPSTAATTVLGDPSTVAGVTVAGVAVTPFEVLSTYPVNQATNLPITTSGMIIRALFNDNIDPATINYDTVVVETEPVDGVDEVIAGVTYSGILTQAQMSVDGDELAILIPSGLLFVNNIVTVTLDNTIASTSSIQMDDDYQFYFTSHYDPLYSSVRKVRLEVGAYVTELPDDTLNFAIYEASKEADFATWTIGSMKADYYEFVRRQWVTCKAAEILLSNTLGISSGIKGKKLADLEVQYDTGGGAKGTGGLDRVLACLAKWSATLQAGGYAVQEPVMTIKGIYDPDRPRVGRLWEPSNLQSTTPGNPLANGKSLPNNSRRYTTGYYSRWFRK